MLTAVDLVLKVAGGKLPPKVLAFRLFDKLSRVFRTTERRFGFESVYAETSDPWNYRSSAYEHSKYQKTLEHILALRRGADSALELACSIGQFSSMLASNFQEVTSVDIAEEALKTARDYNRANANVTFKRSAIEDIKFGRQYDVVTCAEVLYYIEESLLDQVAGKLALHMKDDGILVTVFDTPHGEAAFHFWEEALRRRFTTLLSEAVNNPIRPYRVSIFAKGPAVAS